MSPYPPLPTNLTTPQSIAIYMNEATPMIGGAWTAILFAIFVLMFIGLNYRADSKDAFTSASFVCMILAILLRALDLVPESIMNVFLILGVIGIALIWVRER